MSSITERTLASVSGMSPSRNPHSASEGFHFEMSVTHRWHALPESHAMLSPRGRLHAPINQYAFVSPGAGLAAAILLVGVTRHHCHHEALHFVPLQ